MTITPLDIFILVIVVFGLYRLYNAKRGNNKDEPVRRTGVKPSDLRPPPLPRRSPGRPQDQARDQDQPLAPPADELEARRQAHDAYRRAETAWDHFRSKPTGTPEASSDAATRGQGAVAANVAVPQGFDTNEFLAGAKAIYARVVEAWADRDLDDLRQFTTDKAYLDFARRAETETRPPRSELLLVNAQLVDMQEQEARSRATVFYDATYGGPGGSRQAQEVWGFVRAAAETKSHWLLDEIRPVEDSFSFQQ